MGLFISSESFKASYKIAKDIYSISKIDDYITEFEESYLTLLLGAELFKDLKEDYLAANPNQGEFSEDRYKVLFDPISIDFQYLIIKSEGFEKMLTRFCYWEYERDNRIKKNIGGQYKNDQANGTEASTGETNLYQEYNRAVGSFQAIQYYIQVANPNRYDYNKFNGQQLTQSSFV